MVIFSPFISRKRVETLQEDFQRVIRKNIPIYVITRKKEHNEVIDDLSKMGIHVIFASKDFGFDEAFDRFHFKIALVDNSVVYYGSLNILAQFDSSESMMAFRTKRTVSQLIRNFGIDKIVKEYSKNKPELQAFRENNSSTASAIPSANIQQKDQSTLIEEEFIGLQRSDISNESMISRAFWHVEPGTDVRKKAALKIWKMGKDIGFNSYTEYEVPNLLNDGSNRFISVVWKEGSQIIAAFQIRRKKQKMHLMTSLKDRRKLAMLSAKEKYIVNVSEKNGSASFFRVTESDNRDLWSSNFIEKPKGGLLSGVNNKAYDVERIRLKYARAYESWSEAEDKQLLAEYNENLTVNEIAKKHQRQRSAIKSRLRKMRKSNLL